MNVRKIYNKCLGERFFNKVIAIYTVITIFVLLLLTFAISKNILSSEKNNAVNYSKQVIDDVNNYFKLRVSSLKLIQSLPYLMKNPYSAVIDFLDSNVTKYSEKDISQRQLINQYLQFGLLSDSSISDIVLLKLNDDSINYATNRENTYYVTNRQTFPTINTIDYKSLQSNKFFGVQQTKLIFTINENDNKESTNTFCIGTNFRNTDFTKVTGILLVNFYTQTIMEAYSKKMDCHVVIVSDSGKVVFDSLGTLDGTDYPGAEDLKRKKSGMIDNGEGIASYTVNELLGVTILCLIPRSQVYVNSKTTIQVIVIIAAICILLSILLSYASMSRFYKRIKDVCSAMDKAKSGDLGNRLRISGNMDEISLIATNFNIMCDNLQNYINEVYVSGIKQKESELKQRTAELYALQSQVNPHFLYNTLEAIRMKAISSGSEDVAKMVRLLGALFRHSMRYEMIIKISEEIGFCKHYLELLSLRYCEKFDYYLDIENQVLGYAIIKNILQPLIENAVVHGIEPGIEKSTISIEASLKNEIIIFRISDNGVGIQPENLEVIRRQLEMNDILDTGNIGLLNVNHRIKMIYGHQYGISIDSTPGSLTVISVKIPAKTEEELEKYV
jgi:two-component system, sensor histidine kinase YesM